MIGEGSDHGGGKKSEIPCAVLASAQVQVARHSLSLSHIHFGSDRRFDFFSWDSH